MNNKIFRSLNLCALAAFLILMISCNVIFDAPQPSWVKKNEKSIPKKYRGTWLIRGDCLEGDSLLIGEKRIYNFKDTDVTLSDSVLLKIYKEDYFLNIFFREENGWLVVLARQEKENIHLYYLTPDEGEELDKLRAVAKVSWDETNKADDRMYTVHADREAFEKILKEKLFKACDTLVRKR